MSIFEAQTYTANIYLGLKEGYDGKVHDAKLVRLLIQEHVDKVGLAVTFTPTIFIYSGGNEPGLIIGLINYPRFPKSNEQIEDIAIVLAQKLKETYGQDRVTIVFTDKTIMLGKL